MPSTETGVPPSKPISTVGWLLGRLRGRDDPLPHRFVRRVGGIFQHPAFVAQVPDVAVAAVNIFCRLLDGNVVRARVVNGFFARDDVPFAPRRDDLQFRSKRLGGELETHLVVALAGAAVRHGVRAEFLGELHLALARASGRANEVPSRYLCS